MDHRPPEDLLDRHWRVAVLVVVVVAALLRLPGPVHWWLNPDEGIYFRAVTDPSFGDFWSEAMATAHPPLYFLILRALAAVSTDFSWLRAAAGISGVAAVYAFMVVGREVARQARWERAPRDRWVGLLAGLALAVSPRAVSLSQVMRPYMLLLLLLAASLVFLLRALRRDSATDPALYAVCACLALTVHYSAVAALAVFGMVVLMDGIRRGFGGRRWRRLALAQVPPGVTLAALYAWHLRKLMASPMADQALEGWLSAYLIRSPVDAWLALVGVHSSLVGDTFAASATVLTIVGLAWAGWTRRWIVVVLGASSIVFSAAAAALGLYPMGATRHAAWLLVFVTPVLAWTVALLLTPRPGIGHPVGRAVPALALAALLVGAAPLSSVLDSRARPREIAERVLRAGNVEAMGDILDPGARPRLVLMSGETYDILSPLFVGVKDAARTSREDGLTHLPWGARDVIVLPTRDFTALPGQLERPDHLYTALSRAVDAFGLRGPGPGENVLIVAGGWRSDGVLALTGLANAEPALGTATYVPGLITVELDFDVYRRVLGIAPAGDVGAAPAG